MKAINTRRLIRSGLASLGILLLLAPHAAAATDDDLDQLIDPNQAQGTGQVVLDAGHVDMGPTLNTGEWRLQIHDDTSEPRYWRNLEDVVLKVSDQSILEVPDNPSFSFLGITPGKQVWVIPQVERNGVIWAGWNTQEPGVLSSVSGGVTLRMLDVEGPGDVTVYLQGGNFSEPKPLWTTREQLPQDVWIELNTHTHANWVFDAPGVYFINFEASATLTDGTQAVSTDVLRIAVGNDTDPQTAFGPVEQTGTSPQPSASSVEGNAEQPDQTRNASNDATTQNNPLTESIIWIVAGVVVVVLIISGTLISLSNRKVNQAALERALAAQDSAVPSKATEERKSES
ncbi:choice-of-anchor M domain-containing protein [Populibacterium corticicola]|uniref:Choice-of-anchor M domain-containing protein n=1 Tax=Populibacterium corticicola TaxID=1812826 RepID=A0ABW5XGT5_9MICO